MDTQPLARMTLPPFDRLGRQASPFVLEMLSAANSAALTGADSKRAALRRARNRERLLAWVRTQMLFRLSPVERRCIELYFFEGRTYREAGAELGLNASSVCRAVQRAVGKLRAEARRRPPTALARRIGRRR